MTAEQQQYDRVLRSLCDALGIETVTKLLAAGSALTENQAVEQVRTFAQQR